ncbi:hypothetical protein [Candidatus Coxiella mudrowiae]|uniref:hypothetical protein n=1 Tax=Candidatus Coxiella mudrowiae TaxID=2054173 RepID=UPI00066264E1|nr:hypothetical protein [Candidatus Coxiella mudrowiae]
MVFHLIVSKIAGDEAAHLKMIYELMLFSKNYCEIESEASYDDERKEADEGEEVRYDTDKIKSLLLRENKAAQT